MKKTLLGAAARLPSPLPRSRFRVPPTRLATGTATTGIARRRRSTTNPTPISTVTSRIMGIPSPTPT
jgi:hypothetical protein